MPAITKEQKKAYDNLKIHKDHRVILCLDGGGMRGILTLQLLKKIEEIAGIPCHEFVDMVAGTSTGAIISGLIAAGKNATEIESLYIEFVTKVFHKRSVLANRFLNMPAYDKKYYREALKNVVGDITLGTAGKTSGVDVLITSKDVTDNEETFFSCFNVDGKMVGTYQDVLLRAVMEATMSAPTYFSPLERFIDGGTTTYNNPSLAALIEAVQYGGRDKYSAATTTLISLGTGTMVKSVKPEEALKPNGPDVYFWLNYVMDESSQDASEMQIDLLRSKLKPVADYRRFQISLDTESLNKIPDRDISALHIGQAKWLRELTDEVLSDIGMDDVSKFGLMKAIGESMVDYIMKKNKFTRDLNDTPSHRDELITAWGNIERIKAQLSSAKWIDGMVS